MTNVHASCMMQPHVQSVIFCSVVVQLDDGLEISLLPQTGLRGKTWPTSKMCLRYERLLLNEDVAIALVTRGHHETV